MAYEVALGRTQLARLAPQSRFAVADSAFNESELHGARLRGHRGRPAADRHARQERRARPRAGRRAGAPQGARGRRRPALRREDLAPQGPARPRQDARRPPPHLRPGGPAAPGRLAARRDLRAGAARLHRRARASTTPRHLPGSVTGAELEAYYQAADVFVCASDHEGFCVPLAEAMGHGVPIVAYGVTAVPETVGGAGPGAAGQVRRAVRGGGRPGARTTRRCARCWRRPAGSGRPASTWPPRRGASCPSLRRPSAPPER